MKNVILMLSLLGLIAGFGLWLEAAQIEAHATAYWGVMMMLVSAFAFVWAWR